MTRHIGGPGQALGDVGRHLNLLHRVAKASGTSLSEALHDGRINAAGFSSLATNCRGGGCAEACEAWLSADPAAREGQDGPDLPGFCVNRDVLAQLRR